MEPTLVSMTEEQRQQGIAALSRLFASLMADKEFMRVMESRRVARQSDSDSGAQGSPVPEPV